MTHTHEAPRAEARPPGVTVTAHAFYFTGEDHLRLSSFNSAAGVTIGVRGRVLRPDGSLEVFTGSHVPNTDRTIATQSFARAEGWLLDAEIFVTAGSPRRGQCFVVLEVVRGFTGAVFPLAALIQGYVTDTQRRGWPGSPLENSIDGAGAVRTIEGTDPGAGAEISESVPAGARWRLLALVANLVTAVAAANREVELVFDDGTASIFMRAQSGLTQTASLTRQYSWYFGAARAAIATVPTVTVPIPDITLIAGQRIRTVTENLQAADDWGVPRYIVEEWIAG